MGQRYESVGRTTEAHRRRTPRSAPRVLWVDGASGRSPAPAPALADQLADAGAHVVPGTAATWDQDGRWTAVVVAGGDAHPAWGRWTMLCAATSTPLVAVVDEPATDSGWDRWRRRSLRPAADGSSHADLVVTVGGRERSRPRLGQATLHLPARAVVPPDRTRHRGDAPTGHRRVALLTGSRWWRRTPSVDLVRLLDTELAADGAELCVIGERPRAWTGLGREPLAATRFTGTSEAAPGDLAACRLGIVAGSVGDPAGAILSLIAHRVPVLAMRPALAGLPLSDGSDVLGFDDGVDLTAAALVLLDEPAHLGRLADAAATSCRELVGEVDRGHRLRRAIVSVARARATAPRWAGCPSTRVGPRPH